MAERPLDVVQGRPIAVIGTGLVGSGWAIVFARAGLSVRLHDAQPGAASAALQTIETQLKELLSFGLVDDVRSIMSRFTVSPNLAEAIQSAAYIQESVAERVDVKRRLFEELDSVCDPATVVGSSTSGIPASGFTNGLAIASRVMVAHPVNPPYLVPVVELVPSPATSPEAIQFVEELMQSLGQSVVNVRKEIEGFVLNRLQGVLLREAMALVEDGVASCEDIDKTMRDGLGWRWSFMGPFETIDLNAPGGVRDYAIRLGALYKSIDESRTHSESWTEDLIARVEKQRRELLTVDQLAERRAWRDRRLMEIAASLKRKSDPDENSR